MVQADEKLPAVVALLEWQVSQAVAPIGTWILVFNVTRGVPPLLVKLRPEAWQVAQPDVMPAWLMVQVLKPPGAVRLVWQVLHAAVVGIWLLGLVTTGVPPEMPT